MRARAALAGLAALALLTAGCATSASRPVAGSTATASATGPGGAPVGVVPPRDFAPTTASFVGADLGFVLGLSPCVAGSVTLCEDLLRTDDGGDHWAGLVPPPLLVLTDPTVHPLLRFADALDGVASDGQPGTPLAVTHDGGETWQLVALPGATATTQVTRLDSDHGRVVVVAGDTSGQRLWTGVATQDSFTATALSLPGTAAPVSLALADGDGWVTAGPTAATTTATYARSTDGGKTWTALPSPCTAGQSSAVAASPEPAVTPTAGEAVVIVCQNPPQGLAATRTAYASADGGLTFTSRGGIGSAGYLAGLAAASSTVLTLATSAADDDLLRSGDGAGSFALTYSSQEAGTGQGLYDLAFTDATHGSVVLGNTGSYALELSSGRKDVPTTRLLLTDDGGGHWGQAIFAR